MCEQLSFGLAVEFRPVWPRVRSPLVVRDVPALDTRYVIWKGGEFLLYEASSVLGVVLVPAGVLPEFMEPLRHHVAVAWRGGQVLTSAQVFSVYSELLKMARIH